MNATNVLKGKNYAQTDRQQEHRRKAVRGWIVYGVVILLLLAAIAALIGVRYSRSAGEAEGAVSGGLFPGMGESAAMGHLPGMTQEQIQQQMQHVADESKFSFKINAQPVFEDGASEGTLRIENPSHNAYPIAVEIYRTDTQKKVYDSGGLPPDSHIDRDRLLEDLDKGSYGAQAVISVYDPQTNEYLGRSIVNLTIIVRN